jgi:hypothetical protein
MTTENKTSLLLALLCIAIALSIAAHSKAGSPATNPPVLFCGLLIDCAVG